MIKHNRGLLFVPLLLCGCANTSAQASIFADSECASAYEHHFLNRAAQSGDLIGVELLLRNGANPNGYANDNYVSCVAGIELGSALLPAVTRRHYEVVEALLKAGANPFLPEGDGTTPYSAAKQSGDIRMIGLIERYRK